MKAWKSQVHWRSSLKASFSYKMYSFHMSYVSEAGEIFNILKYVFSVLKFLYFLILYYIFISFAV